MVNEKAIKKELKDFMRQQAKAVQQDPEAAIDAFCGKMANLIANAIRSATITVPAGIAVTTTGGAGATTAAVTAKIT